LSVAQRNHGPVGVIGEGSYPRQIDDLAPMYALKSVRRESTFELNQALLQEVLPAFKVKRGVLISGEKSGDLAGIEHV
jgi:hypothetical protein